MESTSSSVRRDGTFTELAIGNSYRFADLNHDGLLDLLVVSSRILQILVRDPEVDTSRPIA